MSPDVLRRKLQKKKKRKTYRTCGHCGGRAECYVRWDHTAHAPRLFLLHSCGYRKELFWTGGGTGRHVPHEGLSSNQGSESKGL